MFCQKKMKIQRIIGCAKLGPGQIDKIIAQMIRISKPDYQRNLHLLKCVCQVGTREIYLGGKHANKLIKSILLAED